MQTVFLLYLLCINIITFSLRGRDKRQATRGRRRVSEKQLLFLVILGGGAGALAGQHLFRHKTIKGTFVWKLYLGILAWVIALVAIVLVSA